MHATLESAVKKALAALGAGEAAFSVERPRLEHGDYSTNAALSAAKLLKKNPKEVAELLKKELEGKVGEVEKIEIAGAGFLNFWLSRDALVPEVRQAQQSNEGKTALVEYTSPNLFKPLHIGNLVGNILGESITRLLEQVGTTVKRINYPSDIGLTVAKGVWGLAKLKLDPADIAQLGKAYVAGNAAYEDGSAKQEIEEINRALYENSNPEWSELRRRGVETSRKHLDELCARLGTKFDKEFFESESGPVGAELVRGRIGERFEESEGAVVYRGEQEGLHTRVFLNSQGLPTYEAKDLGLFKLKLDYCPNFDISITDTGPEQKDYFKVIFAVATKVFPALEGKTLRHSVHGYLKLTTGKMASRLGNVITGESLIAELKAESAEKMRGREVNDPEVVAEQVAIGALKYAVLRQGSGKDIIFDPEQSLSLEGDSGPYLQYARVRAASLVREGAKADLKAGTDDMPQEASELERVLVHFPDVVARAAAELEPHYVTTYLTELAGAFNSWYANNRVIGGTNPHYGLLVAAAVERVLGEGLSVLGIPAPEEM